MNSWQVIKKYGTKDFRVGSTGYFVAIAKISKLFVDLAQNDKLIDKQEAMIDFDNDLEVTQALSNLKTYRELGLIKT